MIPEIAALDARKNVIRIPNQIDVPVTERILRLIDTPAFQRLSRIRQLGLVSFVYPGANHTRFEHSLGVYRNSLLFIRRLHRFDFFRDQIEQAHIEALIAASLLHDIGHWPFCHPIEDMGMPQIPAHESIAAAVIRSHEISGLLSADWNVDPELVVRLIAGDYQSDAEQLLCSILSGPIDIDKMDYLYRDSLHCGVPYGMNFDAPRLINSVRINAANSGIAISSKGKTAAEMMVFARYVMFSEVYWHHAVRSATAMLQRAFYRWCRETNTPLNIQLFSRLDEHSFVELLRQETKEPVTKELIDGLFGAKRQLYKRLLDYNANQNPQIYSLLSHRPMDWLIEIEDRLGKTLAESIGKGIRPGEIMIDAPPPGLEVQFQVEVNDSATATALAEISPVVKALARKQFDDFVKRVRIFVHPRLLDTVNKKAAEECLKNLLQNVQ